MQEHIPSKTSGFCRISKRWLSTSRLESAGRWPLNFFHKPAMQSTRDLGQRDSHAKARSLCLGIEETPQRGKRKFWSYKASPGEREGRACHWLSDHRSWFTHCSSVPKSCPTLPLPRCTLARQSLSCHLPLSLFKPCH